MPPTTMKCLNMFLRLIILFVFIKMSCAIEGVIWSKKDEKFVPLFSITNFQRAKNDHLERIRDLEFHNFHGQSITMAFYQEVNIMAFLDNNTRISGICGDLWSGLAEYLNFTLVPIRLEDRAFGIELENGSFTGISGLIQRGESQVIPRSGIFMSRLSLLQFTMPLWTIRYHLYIRPEWKYDEGWMYRLFSLRLWFSFFIILFISGIAEYISEKYSTPSSVNKSAFSLQDHIFYTIALAATQGCVPNGLHNRSRIVYVCATMFSWVILIAFSSHAIFLMMNKKIIPPFTDMKSLIQNSKYDMISFNGSQVQEQYQSLAAGYFLYTSDVNRLIYTTETARFYNTLCFSEKKIAAFEAEDRYNAVGKHYCRLISTKVSYFETWISSAVKRGFPYKRTFDNGILKMSETGLLDGLKDRWLYRKLEESEDPPFESIGISQVYLIFALLFFGCVLSIFILMVENLIFFRNKIFKYKSQPIQIQIISRNKLIKSQFDMYRNRFYDNTRNN